MTSAVIPTMLWITSRDRSRRSPSDPLYSRHRLEDDDASPRRPRPAMVNMVVSGALIPIGRVRSDRNRYPLAFSLFQVRHRPLFPGPMGLRDRSRARCLRGRHRFRNFRNSPSSR
jgi:hypothetical protein